MSVLSNLGDQFKLLLPKWNRNQESRVSAARVVMDKRIGTWIHWVNAEHLALAMEESSRGTLDMLARVWHEVKQRDDMLIAVIDKRVSAVAQLPFEIIAEDDSAEARKHKEALEYLYNNLTATSVLEPEETGGVTLLLEQMMDAAGAKKAVHELIWQPDGNQLTVTCNFLPLWYFEERTGPLRYRPDLFSYNGVDLEPNAWMVTVGRGLMKASLIAYLCKHLPLRDWVIFCDHYGFPGIKAKTAAPFDSPEWKQLEEVVAQWRGDRAAVISSNADLEQMELKGGASFPYKELIERMDRAIAIMWRGGDLGTLSKDNGTGANPQQEETDLMRNREAARLSETLNEAVDAPAIQWLFGAKPKAWFALKPPAKVQVDQEIKITDHLVAHGVPVSIVSEAQRFGRSLPDEGEDLLTQQVAFTDKLMGQAPTLGSLDPRLDRGDGGKGPQEKPDQPATAPVRGEQPPPIADKVKPIANEGAQANLAAWIGVGNLAARLGVKTADLMVVLSNIAPLTTEDAAATGHPEVLDQAFAQDNAQTLAVIEKLLAGDLGNDELRAFQAKMPALLEAAMRAGHQQAELEKRYGTALVNGLASAAKAAKSPRTLPATPKTRT